MNNQSQQLVKKIVESSREESAKQKMFVEADLAKQEKTLEERIERKRANSSRNSRPKMTSASFTVSNSKKEPELPCEFIDVPPPPRGQQK